MRLGHYELDTTIDEYQKLLNDIASDEKTLVYLDTNILAYMYKLHANARKEFYNWVGVLKNKQRIFIPNWAANEYSNRVTTGKLRDYTNGSGSNKNVTPSNANKMYEALYEMAALFVDDSILTKYGHTADRAKYLSDFRDAINQLDKYTKPFNTQFNVGEIHKEIADNFSDIVLESDVSVLCARADSEGPSRFQHRLPPGFEDGGKDENKFGDLIIWFEILEHAASNKASFEKILFITNDEKKDWVYAPTSRVQIVNGHRKSIANKKPQIKIAHPRLTDEFKITIGHDRLTVCTLANLIESLSKQQPTHYTNIAGAIQIDIQTDSIDSSDDEGQLEQEKTQTDDVGGEVIVGVVDNDTAEIGLEEENVEQDELSLHDEDTPFEYLEVALHDSHYSSEAPGEINEIIEQLKSHNWYQQNPAITKVLSVLQHDCDPSAVFVLGRNIYQSACGNSQKATEFIASLNTKLSKLDDEVANHLLTGMVFEIYFDAQGHPRDYTKFDYADTVLSVMTKDRYEGAREYIERKIDDANIRLAFVPGSSGEPKLPITLKTEPQEDRENRYKLTSVVFNDEELLVDDNDGRSPKNYNILEIRDIISNHYSVPTWALDNDSEIKVYGPVLIIPEDKKLSV
ncbi:PIN-like domain-containing protein [Photobacterium phosphoreum]|nr:PIN domain-containing protein [Photobacterium phosphoreum]